MPGFNHPLPQVVLTRGSGRSSFARLAPFCGYFLSAFPALIRG
jgi:hypothetical protein